MVKKQPTLLELFVKGVSDFNKTLDKISQALEIISAQAEVSPPKEKQQSKPKTKKRSAKGQSATDQILSIIQDAKDGISAKEVIQQTGFDDKKVYNIIHHAHKKGRIKRIGHGRYSG